MVTAGECGIQITLEQRGERFLVLPFGMLGHEGLHAVEREEELNGHRLFAPERAVVVEGGDAFWLRHKVGAVRCGHFRYKVEYGALGCAIQASFQSEELGFLIHIWAWIGIL